MSGMTLGLYISYRMEYFCLKPCTYMCIWIEIACKRFRINQLSDANVESFQKQPAVSKISRNPKVYLLLSKNGSPNVAPLKLCYTSGSPTHWKKMGRLPSRMVESTTIATSVKMALKNCSSNTLEQIWQPLLDEMNSTPEAKGGNESLFLTKIWAQ